MATLTIEELSTGVALESRHNMSVQELIDYIISSKADNVSKLSAICSVDRSMLRAIQASLLSDLSTLGNLGNVRFSTVIKSDELVSQSGDMLESDAMAIDLTATAIRAIGGLAVAGKHYQYELGRISPSIADKMEAMARVYQANYTSYLAFASYMAQLTDALVSLAFKVQISGFAIVLNKRETARAKAKAAQLAADTINSDTTLTNPKD